MTQMVDGPDQPESQSEPVRNAVSDIISPSLYASNPAVAESSGRSAGAVDSLRAEVLNLYGNRIRLRACGLYREGDRLLLVRHRGIGPANTFWSPPGGGVQFGETSPNALIREFFEETGLIIDPGGMLFVNEFVSPPFHAIELFFEVRATGGSIWQGTDPEMDINEQIIADVRLMPFDEIKSCPPEEIHSLFHTCNSLDDVFQLRGYLPK